MSYTYRSAYPNELCHFGILGMKWGVRRYQNEDGSLTPEGRARYAQQASRMGKNIAKTATGLALTPIGVGIPLAVSGIHGVRKAQKAQRIIDDDNILRRERINSQLNENLAPGQHPVMVTVKKPDDPSKSISERIGEKLEGGDPYPNRPNLASMSNQELKDYVQRMENVQKIENYYRTVDKNQADRGWEWIKDKGTKLGILAAAVGSVALLANNLGNAKEGIGKLGKVAEATKETSIDDEVKKEFRKQYVNAKAKKIAEQKIAEEFAKKVIKK